MTSPPTAPGPVPPPACPATDPMPLYGPEFAANPAQFYDTLRLHGPVAPVELAPGVPAMLVVGYQAVLEVMRHPETFPKDPRRWQATAPPDSPVLPMMAYRPTCMMADGAYHTRLRATITEGLNGIDPAPLRTHIERSADLLISQWGPTGHADLITQYAMLLPLMALNHLFGCPPTYEQRLVTGFRTILDAGHSGDAEKGNAELTQCLIELVAHKRAHPGPDMITRMLQHPAQLTDEEMVHQLVLILGATLENEKNLISNTILLLLSDDRFAGDLSGGNLSIEDAIEEVLWTDPPLANYAISYPQHDLTLHGISVPADQPLLISFAAANTDPSLPRDHTGNRAHIAWGAGPHACPARETARLITSTAVEKLLDELPDIQLATTTHQLTWQPGPFFHTLTSLPTHFTPTTTTTPEHQPNTDPPPTTPPATQPTPPPTPTPHHWTHNLVKWWNGR